jgi:hypothetical protein
VRWDISDQRAHDERAEPIDANEPMDRAEQVEPTDPMERKDPTDAIDSIEPFDPIERNESSDHKDHRERGALTRSVSRARLRTKEGPLECSRGPSPMRKTGLLSPRRR